MYILFLLTLLNARGQQILKNLDIQQSLEGNSSIGLKHNQYQVKPLLAARK